MRYESPDLRQCLEHATSSQLEAILRDSPDDYWRRGGSGEATLSDDTGPLLSITQPERSLFFILRLNGWIVPFDGSPCDAMVESEFGGNPFWIPRACLVGVDTGVEILSHFATHCSLWPGVCWRAWNQIPLPENFPHEQ